MMLSCGRILLFLSAILLFDVSHGADGRPPTAQQRRDRQTAAEVEPQRLQAKIEYKLPELPATQPIPTSDMPSVEPRLVAIYDRKMVTAPEYDGAPDPYASFTSTIFAFHRGVNYNRRLCLQDLMDLESCLWRRSLSPARGVPEIGYYLDTGKPGFNSLDHYCGSKAWFSCVHERKEEWNTGAVRGWIDFRTLNKIVTQLREKQNGNALEKGDLVIAGIFETTVEGVRSRPLVC